MLINRTFLILSVAVVLAQLAVGQDKTDEQDKAAGPKKTWDRAEQVLFDERFMVESRDEYFIEGNVRWNDGEVVLQKGAWFERDAAAGQWVKVDLTPHFSELSPDEPKSAVNFWLRSYQSAEFGDPYIRVRRRLEGGQERCRIALVSRRQRQLGEDNVNGAFGQLNKFIKDRTKGKLQPNFGLSANHVIREVELEGPPRGPMRIEYRFGLVRVLFDEQLAFQGYLENRSSLRAFAVDARQSGAKLEHLKVTICWPRGPDFDEDESAQARQKVADYDEMMRLYRAGRYLDAIPLGENVLEANKKLYGEDSPQVAASLVNLSVLCSGLGDFPRASALVEQAMEIDRVCLGEEHPLFATTLNNLALLKRGLGDNVTAVELLRRAIAINTAVNGEGHVSLATNYANLAGTYVTLGFYPEAEDAYRKATEIQRRKLGVKHPDYATTLGNFAYYYQRMGDYTRARPLYEEALEINRVDPGKESLAYATSAVGLAGALQDLGELQEARALYDEAMAITREIAGEKNPNFATMLSNLATLHSAAGNYAAAEPHLQRALRLTKEIYGDDHPSYAGTLSEWGALLSKLERYGEAREALEAALAIQTDSFGAEHPHRGVTLYYLAELAANQRDSRRAVGLLAESAAIERKFLNANSMVQSERQQKRHQLTRRLVLDRWIAITAQTNLPSDNLLEAIWQWKGAVTHRQQAYRRSASRPELAPSFASLRSMSQELSAMSAQIPDPPKKDADQALQQTYRESKRRWDRRFERLSRQREELEKKIAKESRAFRNARAPMDVAGFRSLLPKGTAYIDFLEYTRKATDDAIFVPWLVAFVVRNDAEAVMVDLGKADPIYNSIADFRGGFAISSGGNDKALAAGQQLRATLWGPLSQHLDDMDTVILSPDTAIGTLPFAALPGDEAGSFLIERYRFATVPLAAMVRDLSQKDIERKRPEKGLLVLGDIDYDVAHALTVDAETSRPAWARGSAPKRKSGWESLAGFQEELAIVRDQFEKKFGGGVTTLRGTQATEAAFIREAGKHYNLHLITHGFFAESTSVPPDRSPNAREKLSTNQEIQRYMPGLLSGIVMAGANRKADARGDGILTASEIESLDLNGVDLVVLSACETGLGATAGGEGLTGLQRAFHIAGARSCVATLWEVDDKATQEVMSRFYRYYWHEGQSKIDALRNAQLDVLRDAKLTRGKGKLRPLIQRPDEPARTDPYFWAAFQLSGEWAK